MRARRSGVDLQPIFVGDAATDRGLHGHGWSAPGRSIIGRIGDRDHLSRRSKLNAAGEGVAQTIVADGGITITRSARNRRQTGASPGRSAVARCVEALQGSRAVIVVRTGQNWERLLGLTTMGSSLAMFTPPDACTFGRTQGTGEQVRVGRSEKGFNRLRKLNRSAVNRFADKNTGGLW